VLTCALRSDTSTTNTGCVQFDALCLTLRAVPGREETAHMATSTTVGGGVNALSSSSSGGGWIVGLIVGLVALVIVLVLCLVVFVAILPARRRAREARESGSPFTMTASPVAPVLLHMDTLNLSGETSPINASSINASSIYAAAPMPTEDRSDVQSKSTNGTIALSTAAMAPRSEYGAAPALSMRTKPPPDATPPPSNYAPGPAQVELY
jgi:hypothetical protein